MSKGDHGLRTKGTHTGNFGKSKVRGGSKLNDIGHTDQKVVKIAKREDYIQRMVLLFRTTTDQKLRCFAYQELHRLNCLEETRCPTSVIPPYRPVGT